MSRACHHLSTSAQDSESVVPCSYRKQNKYSIENQSQPLPGENLTKRMGAQNSHRWRRLTMQFSTSRTRFVYRTDTMCLCSSLLSTHSSSISTKYLSFALNTSLFYEYLLLEILCNVHVNGVFVWHATFALTQR